MLADGKVLVAGGCPKTGVQRSRELGIPENQLEDPASEVICANSQGSAEVFDPKSGKWTGVSPMSEERAQPQAVAIPPRPRSRCGRLCGFVMVIGGNISGSENKATAEFFDPKTGKWSPAPSPDPLRFGLALPLLGPVKVCGKLCGKIFMVGTSTVPGSPTAAAIFDPVKEKWSPIQKPPVILGRPGYTVTVLASGEVLLLGGLAGQLLPSEEISGGRALPGGPALYYPLEGVWRVLDSGESVGREGHSATPLKNGKVLIAGGAQTATRTGLGSAELFALGGAGKSGSGSYRPTGPLKQPRKNHAAVVLPGDKVLVSGGTPPFNQNGSSAPRVPPEPELYDPQTARWASTTGTASYRGSFRKSGWSIFEMTLLADGRVLATGGIAQDDRALESADIFGP
ncbi:MAG: Kelch repeat-containing protein [Actinomycetota bacterium]